MILGVSGKKFSGKDTLADYLVKNYGFAKLEFADKLKKACSEAFNYPHEWNYDFKEKEKDRNNQFILTHNAINIIKKHFDIPDEFKFKTCGNCWFSSVREVLQRIGTDYLRNQYDTNIHVKATLNGLKDDVNYVVVGVRFKNELDAICSFNDSEMVYVKSKRGVNEDSHMSENSIDEDMCKNVLTNDETLLDFHKKIDKWMNGNY